MFARPDFNARGGVVSVGFLFLREGLDVALAGLVDIIDDPGLFCLALRGFPSALAN